MQEADLDGDGTLDYAEFSTIINQAHDANSVWAKAGRGARLLKGIDEGLVNIHGLVQKSWSTNEAKTFHISSTALACSVMLSVTV